MLLSTMKWIRTLFWRRASLIFCLDFNTTFGIFLVSLWPANVCVVKGIKSKMNLEDNHKGRHSFGGQGQALPGLSHHLNQPVIHLSLLTIFGTYRGFLVNIRDDWSPLQQENAPFLPFEK